MSAQLFVQEFRNNKCILDPSGGTKSTRRTALDFNIEIVSVLGFCSLFCSQRATIASRTDREYVCVCVCVCVCMCVTSAEADGVTGTSQC